MPTRQTQTPNQASAINAKVPLSDRIRPNSEAAPWVVEEVKRMEAQHQETLRLLRDAYAAMVRWGYPDLGPLLAREIRAHLAAMKGTQ